MIEALGDRLLKSPPAAFQDGPGSKVACRFLANGNVSEDRIREGHFAASALRVRARVGPIPILQGTPEISFRRSAAKKVGFMKVSSGRRLKEGRCQKHAICGL